MTRDDRVAICERKHDYCYRLDATDIDRFVDCFVDDAHLEVSVYGTARGAAELREFVSWVDDAVAHSAHLVANPIIDVENDTATGIWYYVVVLEYPDGEVEFGQGRYHDDFRYVDGEWKLEAVRAERAIGVPIG